MYSPLLLWALEYNEDDVTQICRYWTLVASVSSASLAIQQLYAKTKTTVGRRVRDRFEESKIVYVTESKATEKPDHVCCG